MFPPARVPGNRRRRSYGATWESLSLRGVAALAYLLLPISGGIAYFFAKSPRVRLHGLQAALLGALWPAALYAGARVSPGVTQAVFVVMGVIWLVVMASAAVGKDLWFPGLGRLLNRVGDPPGE